MWNIITTSKSWRNCHIHPWVNERDLSLLHPDGLGFRNPILQFPFGEWWTAKSLFLQPKTLAFLWGNHHFSGCSDVVLADNNPIQSHPHPICKKLLKHQFVEPKLNSEFVKAIWQNQPMHLNPKWWFRWGESPQNLLIWGLGMPPRIFGELTETRTTESPELKPGQPMWTARSQTLGIFLVS